MFLLILRQSKNQLAEWKVDFSDHETEHQCQWCCEPAGSSEVEVCGVFTESGVFETETSFLWSVAVNPSRLCHLSQTEAKQETRFCVCVMQTSKRYSAGRRTEVKLWLQSLWDRISKRPRLKDCISFRLPPNPPREFDQQFPENCWSNAKRLFVNTLKHDSSGSDLRQIIRNVWECLTEAEGEVIRQEAGLTAVLHHKSSKRLSQAVAQCAVGKKESPGSVKRRVNGLV